MGKKRNDDHSPSREKKKKVFTERLRGMFPGSDPRKCNFAFQRKIEQFKDDVRQVLAICPSTFQVIDRVRHIVGIALEPVTGKAANADEGRIVAAGLLKIDTTSVDHDVREVLRVTLVAQSVVARVILVAQSGVTRVKLARAHNNFRSSRRKNERNFRYGLRKNDEVEIDTEQLPAGALGAESTAPVDREQHASVTTTDNENQPDHEVDLGEDVLNVIGPRLEPDQKKAPALHKDIVIRWKEIFEKGISNEENKNLVKKYNFPENCGFIAAPVLNSEVIAAIQENVKTRDKCITEKQERIAACMAANGKTISITLKSDSPDKLERLEIESDIGRLLAFLQREESEIRKSLILANLNSSVREILTGSTVDGFLFGENLEEKIKTAKTIERASKDLYV
ncbi:uncharacterized protein LOC124180740 [Neodiprion fabricii]|uniref:uncharacterized protein LOC124180740 n=1 Tax=Neodiprion fabricii TaxID=2872261 RepID=UPI001ED8C2FA|nr:uncharacterized protein LOC124180740 [Neodiprion fabricii]